MFKGIASAFLVLLLFGVALGASLFRPSTPNPTSDVLIASKPEGEQAPAENTNSTLADVENILREIEQGQTRLDQERQNLQADQVRLSRERENLQVEQDRLAQDWKKLREEASRLARGREQLRTERVRLDEEWVRLRKKESSLAEREQRLRGFLNWSIVAAIVSSLMAVPSVLFLVALKRQGRLTPDKEPKQAQASWLRKREQVTQHGRHEDVVPTLAHGDNGRGKESVSHRA